MCRGDFSTFSGYLISTLPTRSFLTPYNYTFSGQTNTNLSFLGLLSPRSTRPRPLSDVVLDVSGSTRAGPGTSPASHSLPRVRHAVPLPRPRTSRAPLGVCRNTEECFFDLVVEAGRGASGELLSPTRVLRPGSPRLDLRTAAGGRAVGAARRVHCRVRPGAGRGAYKSSGSGGTGACRSRPPRGPLRRQPRTRLCVGRGNQSGGRYRRRCRRGASEEQEEVHHHERDRV